MPDIDLATASPEQLASVEPAEFIQLVKKLSDKDIKAVMDSVNREPIIAAIFGRMPSLFRADRAGSTTATTHWSITGRPNGGADEWTVAFADGMCTVTRGHDGDATLSLAMGPAYFTKVITKTGNNVVEPSSSSSTVYSICFGVFDESNLIVPVDVMPSVVSVYRSPFTSISQRFSSVSFSPAVS